MSSGGSGPTIDPAVPDAPTRVVAPSGHIDHPKQIGPYIILSVLGEGGMGIVYVAEQRTPVQRRVALKLIKLGMDTRQVLARFDVERQALALMDHPNIARVYDASATDQGRPYFVMELVSGIPITRYCDKQKLSTARRLELFAQVCDAVQHAHTKGIIHRDLKPGNVLVTEADGKAVVKVIDFGVAKAVNQRLTERTLFTEVGMMVGTPEYMSPEQAEHFAMDVDARTDVYSLGVILYELLTGRMPFDPKSLRSHAFSEVQRIIREVEPPKPSTRLTKLTAEEATALAEERQESVATLVSKLRRELEWIPLKAMRKERAGRYRTASELADDVRNYLQGKPLIAGPESRGYRVRKFLRRNRPAVAVTASMLLLLIAGIIGTTYQAVRANRQRAVAQRRFNDVRTLAKGLLFEVHPLVDKLAGSTPATRKIIDMSLEYLSRLQADSSDDLQLLHDVTIAYSQLGDIQGNPNFNNVGDVPGALRSYADAERMARRTLALAPDNQPALNDVAVIDMRVGDVVDRQGKRDEASARYKRAGQTFARLAAMKPQDFRSNFNVIVPMSRLAELQMDAGDIAGATVALTERLKMVRALAARFPDEQTARLAVADALGQLADVQLRAGEFSAAADNCRERVAILEKELSADPDNVTVQRKLGGALTALARLLAGDLGDDDAALTAVQRAVLLQRRAYELDPANTILRATLAQSMIIQSDVLKKIKRFDEAESVVQQTIALYKKGLELTPSDQSLKTMLIVVYGGLADLQEQRSDFAAANASRAKGMQMLKPLVDADPENAQLQAGLAYTNMQIALTLTKQREEAKAIEPARAAVAIFERLATRNPSDAANLTNLHNARRALFNTLDGLITNPATSASRRAEYRREARALLKVLADRYGQLKQSGGLSEVRVKELDAVNRAMNEIDDDARIGAPATRPSLD